jgi:pyrroloquinoline quinone biosynthesis protein E
MNEITTKKYKTIKEHGIEAPLALLAELSHRCPLQCPYCSNPVQLEKKTGELTTDEWKSVIDQAVELGMHQIHLSGGEPTVRNDLEEIVEHCTKTGLYSNLITSGVLLNPDRIEKLEKLGLEHVQLSFQDTESENADKIGGFKGGHEKN